MIALLLTLAACAPLQDDAAAAAPAPEDAARARLDALIASSNDLPGFRAEYVLRRGEQELGRIELLYAAKDRLLMSNRSEKGSARVGIADGRLWMESESPAAGAMAGVLELDDRGGTFEAAMAVLEQAFPRPPEQVDVGVRLFWGIDPKSDKTEFDLEVAWVRTGEERLLGWLQTMRTLDGRLSLEQGVLVHDSPRVRAEVDLEHGFLRRLHMLGTDGEERELSLVSLDLQGPFPADAFLRPEPAQGARDVSEPLRNQMLSPAELRSESLLHIDTLLRLGKPFDESARADLRRFLEELHRPVLVASVERWRTGVQKGIAEFAVELEQRRQAGTAEAELQPVIDERRAVLVTSLEDTLTKLRASLESAMRNPQPSEHWAEVRRLEDEVVGKIYRSEVAEPLLATFDEDT